MTAALTFIHVTNVIWKCLAGNVHHRRLVHVIPNTFDSYFFNQLFEEP